MTHSSILKLALVIACITSAYFYTGYYASDDMSYLGSVMTIAQGGQITPDLASARLAVVLPASAVYYLTNGSLFLTIFSFTFYHLGLVCACYILGQVAHNKDTGAIAALIAACCPLSYVFAGAALPDVALAMWVGLWAAAVVYGARITGNVAISNVRRYRVWILAGLLNGIAYSVKESGLILAVPAALAMICSTPKNYRHQVFLVGICYSIGISVVLGIELVLLYAISGQWIFRLGIVTTEQHASILKELAAASGPVYLRFAKAYHLVVPFIGKIGLIAASISVLLYCALRKSLPFLAYLVIWVVVYQTIGSTSFSNYVPPALVHRYYLIALPAISVMAAWVLLSIVSFSREGANPEKRLYTWRVVAAATVVLTWGTAQFYEVLPSAGLIYRARDVKAFSLAYREARARFPDMHIVLSPYCGFRMYPVFAAERGPKFHLTAMDPQGNPVPNKLPDPPFLYIRAVDDSLEDNLLKLPLEKFLVPGTFKYEDVETFSPPENRWSEIILGTSSIRNDLRVENRSTHSARAFKIQKVLPLSQTTQE